MGSKTGVLFSSLRGYCCTGTSLLTFGTSSPTVQSDWTLLPPLAALPMPGLDHNPGWCVSASWLPKDGFSGAGVVPFGRQANISVVSPDASACLPTPTKSVLADSNFQAKVNFFRTGPGTWANHETFNCITCLWTVMKEPKKRKMLDHLFYFITQPADNVSQGF